jgi:hypothetical protein
MNIRLLKLWTLAMVLVLKNVGHFQTLMLIPLTGSLTCHIGYAGKTSKLTLKTSNDTKFIPSSAHNSILIRVLTRTVRCTLQISD